MTEHPNLFELREKTFYKIGEVADVVGVKAYVLRYWESEFNSLDPHKSGQSKHRMYTREDIDLLLTIKGLLYDEMYTVAGARRQLAALQRQGVLGVQNAVEGADDPLDGTERAAFEQQVEELTGRLHESHAERDEALSLARETGEAIAEVETARHEAAARAEALEISLAAANQTHAAALASLERELTASRARIEALETQRVGQLDAAWPEDLTGKVVANASVELERELRNKLSYQVSSRRRVLKVLRGQVAELLDLVQPVDDPRQVAAVGAQKNHREPSAL